MEESTAGSVGVETAELPAVGFPNAVKLGFQRYFDFSGRSSRAEFWWWLLFNALGGIGAFIIDAAAGSAPTIQTLFSIALFIPNLAIGVRRLHDINKSGWWQLIAFTIIGMVPLIIWCATEGTKKNNSHGKPIKLKK